jgi:CRP-like cAMP-binding protein
LSSSPLHRINTREFFKLIETAPQFSDQIFRSLVRQHYFLKICSAQSGSVSLRLRSEQLFWQLLRAQSRDGAAPNGLRGECKLLAPATNKYLAQMLGIARESFVRTLGEMEKDGILRRRNGWRIFLDPERLWHALEIESLAESNRGPNGQFTLTDPIYA